MTTSKSIDGVQEITLIAPLKLGIVPCTGDTLSYATRLRLLLGALFSQRKLGTEFARQEDGLLESLQILDFVRWAIIDDDTKLMLAVSFDGPWEPYIRRIVEKAGPVLDAIFCHCADYGGSSCYDGYPKFSAWVRQHQIDVPFIHVANADLTVDDVRYLKAFESAHSRGDTSPFALSSMRYLASRQPLSRVYALFGLSTLFVGEGGTLNDRQYFDRVSYLILEPDFGLLNQGLAALKKASPNPGLRDAAMAAWVVGLQKAGLAPHPAGPHMDASLREGAQIQGNILSSYADTLKPSHGAVALVRFKGKVQGGAFLKRVSRLISFEKDDGGPIKLNLALTFQGLRTLGLTKPELASFPREFQEGLEERAPLLGDIGANHPEAWSLPQCNWPRPSSELIRLSLVDAVLNVQTVSTAEGHELDETLRDFLANQVEQQGSEIEILHVQPTRRYAKGHVGAVDGVSQPVAERQPVGSSAERDVVPVGDLLLGYKNSSGEPSSVPVELQLNSTFVAIRKMRQDPSIYASLGAKELELALGRGTEGENLIDGKIANAFDYATDKDGQKCPFFSHVRRSNPRIENTPRILRRGMSYGPPYQPGHSDSAQRGVMFMAIAANLAEQYEVVQRWVNGGNITGVFSGHPDLIAGTYPSNSQRKLRYLNMNGEVATLAVPSEPAAVLEWGLYAFIPSLAALELLATGERPSFAPARGVAQVRPSLNPNQFGAEPLSEAGDAMKARLEDVSRPGTIEATLSAVLEDKGIGRASEYGVVIGAPRHVAEALTTPAKYSVRNYWARMRECDATLYLGMDPDPKPLGLQSDPYLDEVPPGRYQSESRPANDFISGIKFTDAFAAAREAALKWCTEQASRYDGLLALIASQPDLKDALEQPPALSLVAMSQRVIRDVACELYGLPPSLLSDDVELDWPAGTAPATAETAVRCPVDLTKVFAHVFPPRPSHAVSVEAEKRGKTIKERIASWCEQAQKSEAAKGPLLTDILKVTGQTSDFVERTVIGLLSGFAVPTNGSLLGVLAQLVATDELWRLQRLLPLDPTPDENLQARMAPLLDRVYELMINAPVPAMISRTPMFEDPLIKPPEVLALHLGVAASLAKANQVPDPWKFLFGDVPGALPGAEPATHRCPGQQMALGVIVGAVYALLEQTRLKKVPLDPLTLSKY